MTLDNIVLSKKYSVSSEAYWTIWYNMQLNEDSMRVGMTGEYFLEAVTLPLLWQGTTEKFSEFSRHP